MKLPEYLSRELLKRYGIPFGEGKVVTSKEEAVEVAKEVGLPVVIKAQVLVGGRGKAGGVKLAYSIDEVREKADTILGMSIKGITVRKVLVARAIDIAKETYIGVVLDRARQSITVMASDEGGVDIEEVAREKPEKIYKTTIDMGLFELMPYQARQLAFKVFGEPELRKQATRIYLNLFRAFKENDATLVEINPLAVDTAGKIYACDAKVIIDDNGLYRRQELMREPEEDEVKEWEAKKYGLSYIKLDGNIGCVVNGAGLAMATMDIIKRYGGEPANFLDIGGSSSPEKVMKAMELLLEDRNVKAIWFNIFGGITRCDDVAKGIVETLSKMRVDVPIVVRLTGTNEDKALKILESANLITVRSMKEGAMKVIELAGRTK